MDLLFLSQRVPFPPNKGEKIRTFHQIDYLSKQHEIAVFTPAASPKEVKYFQQLARKYCSLGGSTAPTSKTKLLKGLIQNKPLSVANFYSVTLQRQFDERLAQGDIDAIVCTASSMAEYIFRSKSLRNLTIKGEQPKLVMDFMDLDSDKWAQYQKLKPFPLSLIYQRERYLLQKYERRIYDAFDASLFISKDEIALFARELNNADKLHCIANGIDTNLYTPGETAQTDAPPILLFTGVMDYLPNEDAVIWFAEAMLPAIRRSIPNVQFVIAGMNPSKAVLRLAEHPGVVVTGFVEDIMPYYHDATVFVAPFRLARGVQNKVLQAFACGLPTLMTPMGNEGIDANNGTECMLASNPKEFIDGALTLLNDPALRLQIGTNARQKAINDFSWSAQLSKLEALLYKN